MLWLEITDFMLGIHLYETLTVFLLITLSRGCEGGMVVSMILSSCPPTLVITFLDQGGFAHVMFLFLPFFFVVVLGGGVKF